MTQSHGSSPPSRRPDATPPRTEKQIDWAIKRIHATPKEMVATAGNEEIVA